MNKPRTPRPAATSTNTNNSTTSTTVALDASAAHGTEASTSAAESHFRALKAELRAIPLAEVITARVDVQVAATAALGTAARLEDPALRSRFIALAHTGEFDTTCLTRLQPLAWAAWYARFRFLAATGVATNEQIPEPLRNRGIEVRTRMMKVARHNLSENPAAVRRLDQIDLDRGDRDLANDLIALSEVYRDYLPELDRDRFYRATDPAEARTLSETIIESLATIDPGAEAAAWQDLQNRAWTALSRVYDQILRAAAFLFWSDPRRDEWFPSIVTAARTPAQRARTDESPTEPASTTPAEPTEPATPTTPSAPATPATPGGAPAHLATTALSPNATPVLAPHP